MAILKDSEVSFVIPVYNESAGLLSFHDSLTEAIREAAITDYEIIYCDDGSKDNSVGIIQSLHKSDKHVCLVALSRNFGKESALVAGIAHAKGKAIVTLDGDGQHPVELIGTFVEQWREGVQVVIGIRTENQDEGFFKKLGSKLFYRLFNTVSRQRLVPGSTDYRLIDQSVQREFLKLQETERMTRALIDWLGFTRTYIPFVAKPRTTGSAAYSKRKLLRLAANSFVSLSPTPLYVFGYLGAVITLCAFLLGSVVFGEQILAGDPLHWKFTGTAMLSILLVFLAGIILLSQGILSLYVSHIHAQSKQRPLYVVDYAHSAGVDGADK